MPGFLGPSNPGGLISRFGGQNNNRLQRFRTPGLNPGIGQPRQNPYAPTGPEGISTGPVGQDAGLSMGGVRPPRMPTFRPGGEQAQYAPMMPSGAVINRFISPQPGAENMATPAGNPNMWQLPWQRRLF
jgi:hypothetical protein